MQDEITLTFPGAVIRRIDAVADEMNLDRMELILEALDLSSRRYEALIARVRQAIREADNGKVIEVEEFERQMRSWRE
jgi:predicted transcriptional regulator